MPKKPTTPPVEEQPPEELPTEQAAPVDAPEDPRADAPIAPAGDTVPVEQPPEDPPVAPPVEEPVQGAGQPSVAKPAARTPGTQPPGATRAGLPNTCSVCGKGDLPYWFADNADAAIAGQGLCEECDGLQLRPGER